MFIIKNKGKFYPIVCHEYTSGVEEYIYSFFNIGARCVGQLTSRLCRIASQNDAVPIAYEAE
jgi:hypothetical protein